MTDAGTSATDQEHGSEVKDPTTAERGAQATAGVLENPEGAAKIKGVLVETGVKLREKTETPKTRQALAQKLLNELTPEAQIKFIEDTQGFIYMMKEGVMGQFTLGLRNVWKTVAPSWAPEDWVSLETFHDGELKAYIALGAMNVEERVAAKVDKELKDKIHMVKILGIILSLIPDLEVIGEPLLALNNLSEPAVKFLTHALPEVRAEVRARSTVTQTIADKSRQLHTASSPMIEDGKTALSPKEDLSASPTTTPSEFEEELDWSSIQPGPLGRKGSDSGVHANL